MALDQGDLETNDIASLEGLGGDQLLTPLDRFGAGVIGQPGKVLHHPRFDLAEQQQIDGQRLTLASQ